jgi:flagellar protein FliO/FliZ
MKAFLIAVFVLVPALAQASSAGAGSPTATLFKALAGLVLVLGLVLLLYALSRRGLGLMPGNRTGRIKVLEARGLGPKKALYLIEVAGQEMLIGVGSERVELVAHLGAAQQGAFDRTLGTELEKR